MSKDNKDISTEKLCVVSFGFRDIVMPMKAALVLFNEVDACMELRSEWDSDTKTSFDTMEQLTVTLKAFSAGDYAIRKLQTQAWKDRQREKEQRKKEAQ